MAAAPGRPSTGTSKKSAVFYRIGIWRCLRFAVLPLCNSLLAGKSFFGELEYRNIAQTARLNPGFTLVSGRIGIPVESLRNRQTGQRRPPGAAVWRMAARYGAMILCCRPVASGKLGGVLPVVEVKSLEQATMRFFRLFIQFAKSGRLDQLLEIDEDGVITAGERPLHDAAMAGLRGIITTVPALDHAAQGQKKSAQRGTGRD